MLIWFQESNTSFLESQFRPLSRLGDIFKVMIGLGQIPSLGNTQKVYESRLFREVAQVDDKEAEQGAMHSDLVRLSSREKEDILVSQRTLAGRLSSLWKTLKTKTTRKSKPELEDDCPVSRARAGSLVGENTPLGWLTYDQMSQDDDSPTLGREAVVSSTPQEVESREISLLSFLRPDPEDDDCMFNEEWFLSPAG